MASKWLNFWSPAKILVENQKLIPVRIKIFPCEITTIVLQLSVVVYALSHVKSNYVHEQQSRYRTVIADLEHVLVKIR